MMGGMTPRQQRFVQEYLIDLNATQAYIRAGYAPDSAYANAVRLMENDGVKAAIAEKQQEAAERAQLSVQWVLDGLIEATQRSMQAFPVRDKEGNVTGEWTFAPTQAMRGYELLGKHLGMWPTKITITDADREAARVAAAALGLDESAVLAEVERELKEARG